MIERALLFQDSLEELYVKECPTSGGTIHPEHVRDLQILLSQSRYHEKILAVKGASGPGVAKAHEFEFHKSVERQPPPAPAPNDDTRAGDHDDGLGRCCDSELGHAPHVCWEAIIGQSQIGCSSNKLHCTEPGLGMGWDNERYPKTKKNTFDLSFFGITHSSFSDYSISLLDLEYSIPEFLILGYPFGFRDIQKPQKISLRYPAPGHISDTSLQYHISLRYPKLRLLEV
jgi:hypothetical protein